MTVARGPRFVPLDRVENVTQGREGDRVNPLDEDVENAATSQAGGERIVVAHAVTLQ